MSTTRLSLTLFQMERFLDFDLYIYVARFFCTSEVNAIEVKKLIWEWVYSYQIERDDL
jgi:hypothetical protein